MSYDKGDATRAAVDAVAWDRLRDIAEKLKRGEPMELDQEGVDHLVKLVTLQQEAERSRVAQRQTRVTIVTACVSVLTLLLSACTTGLTLYSTYNRDGQERIKSERTEVTEALKTLATNRKEIFGDRELTADEWKAMFATLRPTSQVDPHIVSAWEAVAGVRNKARTGAPTDEQNATQNNAQAAATQTAPPPVTNSPSKILAGVIVYPQCADSLMPADRDKVKLAVTNLGGSLLPWQTVTNIPKGTTVRYYKTEDQVPAEAIASAIRRMSPTSNATAQSLVSRPIAKTVRQRMIEIWIGRDANL